MRDFQSTLWVFVRKDKSPRVGKVFVSPSL